MWYWYNSYCTSESIHFMVAGLCMFLSVVHTHVNYSTGNHVHFNNRLSPCDLQVYRDHTQLRRPCSPAGPAPCPYCPRRWAAPPEGHLGWACLDLCLTSGPSQSCAETAAPSGSQRRYFLVGPDQGSGTTLEVAGEEYKSTLVSTLRQLKNQPVWKRCLEDLKGQVRCIF